MKTKVLLINVLMFITVFGCKQKETEGKIENIIEEETVVKLPNNSDEKFMKVLSLLDEQKGKEAAVYLKEGIAALKIEGKDESGLYKTNLKNSIEELTSIASNLENGKSVSTESVREAIANAEINIAHNYLTSSDIYVLENSDNVISNKIKRNFNKVLKNLKNEEGKLKKDAKKSGDALLKEGKKLEKEYKEWENKAKEYTKKMNEHFNEHYPNYYMPYYF